MLLLEDMAMDYYVAAVLQKASFKVVIQTEHTVEDSMVDLNTFMWGAGHSLVTMAGLETKETGPKFRRSRLTGQNSMAENMRLW